MLQNNSDNYNKLKLIMYKKVKPSPIAKIEKNYLPETTIKLNIVAFFTSPKMILELGTKQN